mmetsp:Transcript_21788/g.40602  ORF Transcript_21788/g.40602 Transcript_21788/m.40602 type:complete len:592 (+) Transcript_21788:44-1819(+)
MSVLDKSNPAGFTLLVLAATLLGIGANLLDTKTSSQPHVILFVIDDQGYSDIGYQKKDFASLSPALDAAAHDGIKLTSYYTQEQCTPARASLLTGKYPSSVGMQVKTPDLTEPWGVPLQYTMLPEVLKYMGYKTHAVGKWHLGFSKLGYLPEYRGFDFFAGYYSGKEDYYDHTATTRTGHYYNDLHEGMSNNYDISSYSADIYSLKVHQILEEHDNTEPLFLYYSNQLMHAPLELPPDHYFSDEDLETLTYDIDSDDNAFTDGGRTAVAKMLRATDRVFEKMVESLKSKGMYDDSIIIVMSDNGGCPYYSGYNVPLRGHKNTVYEGGVRVNAFIHSPLLPKSVLGEYPHLFHISDIFPTILEGFLGYAPEALGTASAKFLDGVNQFPALLDSSLSGPRTELLHNVKVESYIVDSDNSNYTHLFPTVGLRASIGGHSLKLVHGPGSGMGQTFAIGDSMVIETNSGDIELNLCEDLTMYEMADFGDLWSYIYSPASQVFDIDGDMEEVYNLAEEVADAVMDELWQRADHYWDVSAPSALAYGDNSAFQVFADNHYYLCPWQEMSDEDWAAVEGRGPAEGVMWTPVERTATVHF